jgi:hypothetical protein
MKQIGLRVAIVFLLVTSAAFAAAPTKILFTWDYTPNAAAPICTSTVITNCVNSFTLTEPTTNFSQSIPAVAGTSSYSFTQTPIPAAGTYTYSLVAVETTAGGPIQSVPDTVSVTVPGQPAGATNFLGVPQ